MAAAGAALGDQAHFASVKLHTVRERQRVTAALGRLRPRHTDSRADFVFFDAGAKAGAARAAFAATNIQIGKPFPPLDSWLRVTVGTASDNDAVTAVLRRAFGAAT